MAPRDPQTTPVVSSVWADNIINKAETKDLAIENSWIGSYTLSLMELLSSLVSVSGTDS